VNRGVTKKCPILGCAKKIGANQVACKSHWFDLFPAPVRSMIWRLWNRGKPLAGHREYVLDAVLAVNQKLEQKQHER